MAEWMDGWIDGSMDDYLIRYCLSQEHSFQAVLLSVRYFEREIKVTHVVIMNFPPLPLFRPPLITAPEFVFPANSNDAKLESKPYSSI